MEKRNQIEIERFRIMDQESGEVSVSTTDKEEEWRKEYKVWRDNLEKREKRFYQKLLGPNISYDA